MRILLDYFRRVFSNHEFIFELQNGVARAAKGRLLDRALRELADCAKELGIVSGSNYGERGPGYVRLVFSKEFPPWTHQQFRNIWSQYS